MAGIARTDATGAGGMLPELLAWSSSFEQDRALRKQLDAAHTQLAERKLVERAKGILMDEAGFSEDQAYRHLRKLAMDRGQRLGQAAALIVEARELLRPPA